MNSLTLQKLRLGIVKEINGLAKLLEQSLTEVFTHPTKFFEKFVVDLMFECGQMSVRNCLTQGREDISKQKGKLWSMQGRNGIVRGQYCMHFIP